MATVKKHVSKNGKITYYIRTYDGYDSKGKQIERSMTWKPPEGMTPKQMEKELQKQIVKFEESVKCGNCFDSDTRFGAYAENWLENNRPPLLAPKTYERYKALLKNVNAAIGDIKLVKLQSHHLQEFYHNLREAGIKQVGAYAASDKLRAVMRERSLTNQRLATLSGVSSTTVSSACKPDGHISLESAEKIAKGLKIPVKRLFEVHQETSGLSAKTILHHHRLISSILAQAARDRLVPYNVADRNYIKAPKLDHTPAEEHEVESTEATAQEYEKLQLDFPAVTALTEFDMDKIMTVTHNGETDSPITIGIAALQHHNGCTHTAFEIAGMLSKKYSAAIVMADKGTLDAYAGFHKIATGTAAQGLNVKGIDVFPLEKLQEISGQYSATICDFGYFREEYKTAFGKCDVKIMLCSAAE